MILSSMNESSQKKSKEEMFCSNLDMVQRAANMDSNRPFLYTNRFKGFSYRLISHCNNLEFLEFSRLSHIPSLCAVVAIHNSGVTIITLS